MNRLGAVPALVLASVSSIACTASSEEGQEEQAGPAEDNVQSQQQQLTCRRFPTDSCVTVGNYCERHGGQLWCDLAGNCTCRYTVFQASPVPARVQ